MKKTSKPATKKSSGNWDRVRILEGDPYLCESALRQAGQSASEIIRIYDTDDRDAVVTALTGFRFGGQPLVVLRTPTDEQTELLTKLAEGGRLTCAGVIAVYPGAYADGRKAITKRIKSSGGLVTKEYTRDYDDASVRRAIAGFCKTAGIRFSQPGLEWMIAHRPTFETKVRDGDARSGSGQVSVIDYMTLFNDLEKLVTLSNAYGIDPLSIEEAKSVWTFVPEQKMFTVSDAIMAGDVAKAMDTATAMVLAEPDDVVGFLMGLISMLRVAANVKQLIEVGITDPDRIAREATLEKMWDLYRYVAWTKGSDSDEQPHKPAPLSRWRVERIAKECSRSSSELYRGCAALGWAVDEIFSRTTSPVTTVAVAVLSACTGRSPLQPAHRELTEP